MATKSKADATLRYPRTKPSEERRRDLLDAGLVVFRRRGVAAAKVEEIVQEAGVAKGTFYLYFPSKEHLVVALQRDFEATVLARVVAAVEAAGDDWADRLDAWVLAIFDDYPARRALHDVIYHYPVEIDETTEAPRLENGQAATDTSASPHNDLVANLANLMAGGIAAGVFHVDDPSMTAALLATAVHRAFDRTWHSAEAEDRPRLIAATQQLFRRALAVGGPSPQSEAAARPRRTRAKAGQRRR